MICICICMCVYVYIYISLQLLILHVLEGIGSDLESSCGMSRFLGIGPGSLCHRCEVSLAAAMAASRSSFDGRVRLGSSHYSIVAMTSVPVVYLARVVANIVVPYSKKLCFFS